MSCSALRHRFEQEKQGGITFERALEVFTDVEGSVSAHRVEMEELRRRGVASEQIRHLEAHIADGERLLDEIKSLRLS
jgi:hypothetical protein